MKQIQQDKNAVINIEQLDIWEPFLADYYKTLNCQEKFYTERQQVDMMEFQLITALTRIEQYLQKKDPSKSYLYERSIRESLEVFYPCVQKYYQSPCINYFVENSYKYFCNYEPIFDEEIFIQTPIEIILKRIEQRNRNGEICSKEYLIQLDEQYKKFFNREKQNKQQYSVDPQQLLHILKNIIFNDTQIKQKDRLFIDYYEKIMEQLSKPTHTN